MSTIQSIAPAPVRAAAPNIPPRLRRFEYLINIFAPPGSFKAVAAKTSGTALGTIYSFTDGGPIWMGKVGMPLGLERNEPRPSRYSLEAGINLGSICEMMASHFYGVWSQEAVAIPITSLSREKVINDFTREHAIAQEWHARGITDCLCLMCRFEVGYQDFTYARTADGDGSISFIDFIKRHHRPPDTLLTPEGKSVPLKGFMEMVAVGRGLGDSDMLGGTGGNAGFFWIRDAGLQIIAAQTMKIDPGLAFQCALQEGEAVSQNKVLNTLRRLGHSLYWFKDMRNIQMANNDPSVDLFWVNFTDEQRSIFLNSITHCIEFVKDREALAFLVKRDRLFNRSPLEGVPDVYAERLMSNLSSWLESQREIFWQQVVGRFIPLELKGALGCFVGRDSLLRQLNDHLLGSTGTRSPIALLHGAGGLGKSELACLFANRHRQDFSLIYCIHSASTQLLELSYQSLARQLLLYNNGDDFAIVRTRVHHYLESTTFDKPWLLIFDNAEEAIPLPQGGRGAILATSRNGALWPDALSLPLSPFSKSDIKDLGIALEKPLSTAEAKKLRTRFNGFPLPITLALHYCKERELTIANYLAELDRILLRDGMDKEWLPMIATLQYMQRSAPKAARFLHIVAWFNPEGVPNSWLEAWLTTQNATAAPEAIQIEAREILQLLDRYGITQSDPQKQSFILHRVVHRILHQTGGEEPEEIREALMLLMQQIEGFDNNTFDSWPLCERWLPHALAAASHREIAEIGDRILLARFYWLLGKCQRHKCQFQEALIQSRKALELRQQFYGTAIHADLAHSLYEVGEILHCLGELEGALACQKSALEMRRALYRDQDHSEVVQSLYRTAVVMSEQHRAQKGLEYAQQALEMSDRLHPGKNHPDKVAALDSMGALLFHLKRHEEALGFCQQVLEMNRSLYPGQNHPDTAAALNNMGVYLMGLKRHQEALNYYQQSLEMKCALYPGQNHPEIASSLIWLGQCLNALERKQEALDAFQQALEMNRALYPGQNHLRIAEVLSWLGHGLSALGRKQEALDAFRQSLEMNRALYPGQNHPKIANSLELFGDSLKVLGRNQEALDAFRQAEMMPLICEADDFPWFNLCQNWRKGVGGEVPAENEWDVPKKNAMDLEDKDLEDLEDIEDKGP